MKLNQEQQEFIKKTLHRELKFMETYEELYDHIITSLEITPNDIPFVDAVHNIIENDLGGAKCIQTIQAKHINLTVREFALDYFRCALKCLTSSSLLFISISTVLFFMLTKQPWFNETIANGTFGLGIIVGPAGMHILNLMARRNNSGLQLTPLVGHLKSDIRGYFTVFFSFFTYFLLAIPSSICLKLHHPHLPTVVSASIFFIMALHIATCYKLYSTRKIEYTV
jgi:hypothetical protein